MLGLCHALVALVLLFAQYEGKTERAILSDPLARMAAARSKRKGKLRGLPLGC